MAEVGGQEGCGLARDGVEEGEGGGVGEVAFVAPEDLGWGLGSLGGVDGGGRDVGAAAVGFVDAVVAGGGDGLVG